MFDIIDVYTLEIVGHHESFRCRQEALKALEKAVDGRGISDLVLRTDNGMQFRSREFQKYIQEKGIEHERTAVNTPEENSHIESFHGTLKREEIYQTYYQHITHCKNSIAEFIDRYNSDKPYSSVEYLPPVVYHECIVENMIAGDRFAAYLSIILKFCVYKT